MLEGESRQQFEALHAAGLHNKNNPTESLAFFEQADVLAVRHDDARKRLDALQPAARALRGLGRYDEAADRLNIARHIATELGLTDEQAMVISNLSSLVTARIVNTLPTDQQAAALKTEAVPMFVEAEQLLKKHPHFYYRYSNAKQGALVAALAGERAVSARFLWDGASVVFRKSPEPYDQETTYKINPAGLKQFLAAVALFPFGMKTPGLAQFVRTKLGR